MPTYQIAHINQQGTDLIIVPLQSSFGSRTSTDQQAIVADLQAHASNAGLRGTVVPVWESSGRMCFLAPTPWHPFFKSITWMWVTMNLNRKLYW